MFDECFGKNTYNNDRKNRKKHFIFSTLRKRIGDFLQKKGTLCLNYSYFCIKI